MTDRMTGSLSIWIDEGRGDLMARIGDAYDADLPVVITDDDGVERSVRITRYVSDHEQQCIYVEWEEVTGE